MSDYEIMIKELAREVLFGTFGNGEERKRRLGVLYPQVQAAVNDFYSKIKEKERMTETLDSYIPKIQAWADERGLKDADPNIQWMRVTEEIGEIRDVLLKPTKFDDPQAAMKDALGDSIVTLVVLAYQLDMDLSECLRVAYDAIKDRKGKMVNGSFVKEEDL